MSIVGAELHEVLFGPVHGNLTLYLGQLLYVPVFDSLYDRGSFEVAVYEFRQVMVNGKHWMGYVEKGAWG